MIAEPIERRSSKRFGVDADHAEVVVDFDGADHRAIMSDVSATGFGLLLLKGSRVAPGTHVRLINPDLETTFELEVVHVRPEESFQYVGLRRLSDETSHSIPLFRLAGKTYSLPMPCASPLIFVGVIVGFSTTAITLVELIRGGAEDNAKLTKNSVHEQALIDASNRISPAEKRRRLLARSRERAADRSASHLLEITPNFWERITGPSREQVGRLVGNRNISWSDLIKKLDLSREQQDRIHGLLNSDDAGEVQAARTEMLSMLTAEQRSAYHQLLATLPLN